MSARTLMITLIVLSTIAASGCFEENGDSHSRTQWAFDITHIDEMNDKGYDGTGIIVGIVDTGIDKGHESFKRTSIVAWRDFIDNRDDPYDDHGHGSHVAGIIAGTGDIKGGAIGVELVVAKALDRDGAGTDADVASAIDWCVDEGAHVICLSLGGEPRLLNLGDQTRSACADAIDQGVIVVAAAGNDGENDDGEVSSPANYPKVIAVGAIDRNKRIASFSSQGDNEGDIPFIPEEEDREDPDKKPECVAPGVDITSCWKGGDYVKASGTSQATAFVAAIVALELDAHPDYKLVDEDKVTEFKQAMMDSNEKCPGQNTPHDDHYGYGLVHAIWLNDEL